jgi:hypothetical protein
MGFTVPVLPFNNVINVQLKVAAFVNLDQSIADLSTISSWDVNYPMVAKVYIRQRHFPYNILSKEEKTIELYKFERTKAFEL